MRNRHDKSIGDLILASIGALLTLALILMALAMIVWSFALIIRVASHILPF